MLQGNSVVKIIIKIIIIFSVNDTGIYDKSDTTKQEKMVFSIKEL